MIGKEIGSLVNKRTRGHYLDFSITKISQITDKSPRDLRRLVT